MKKYLLFIFLISSKSFCQSPLVKFNEENKVDYSENAIKVSIIQLISNPEKYDGKFIDVTGFIKIEFEGTALYLHQEDYKNHIFNNSIWLNISKDKIYEFEKECSEKYGSITGTFKAELKGHFGAFSGTITNIKGIYPNDYFTKK